MTDGPPTTVGIIGAGVVGARCARVLDVDHEVVLTDRRRGVAATVAASLRTASATDDLAAMSRCGAVVLACPGDQLDLTESLLRAGVHVVSLGSTAAEIGSLLDLDDLSRQHGSCLVVGAGMSPGLSGLLARWMTSELAACDELHVAMHGTAGPACAREHHRALGDASVGWHEGEWITRRGGSGRELCWFPEPVGAYDCYRADVAEAVTLHRAVPEVTRISSRMSATRRDRFTSWLPMLTPPHPEGGVGALRVEVRGSDASGGRVTLIAGIAERVGTAAAVTAAAFAASAVEDRLRAGVVVAGEASLPTIDLLERIARAGVRLQRFTGVPESLARLEGPAAQRGDRRPPTAPAAPPASHRS